MSYVSTKVKGTYGYLDPDYRDTHKLTRKSDVYSFGVVLLVVLSRRPVLDTSMPEELHNLKSSFRNFSENGELEKVVDPELQGILLSDSLNIYVTSIKKCFHRQPKERPTMAQVVASLEDALKQHRATLFPTSEGRNAISPIYRAGPNKQVRFNEESLLPICEFYTIFSKEDIFDHGQPVLHDASFPMPGKITKLRQKGGVSKQLWGRTWETLWSRGKPIKKNSMVPSDGSQFSIMDIQAVTNNFSDDLIILNDKYKKVYRGQSEQPVMIYRFVIILDKKESLEFCNEIDKLSRLRYSCLLPLVGYVFHENEVFIVYEYSKLCTLEFCLYSQLRTVLSWKQRLRICISVARGLAYLHEEKVIHRDMKPGSILLGEDLTSRITNFGLSKVGPAAQFALNEINTSCSEYLSPDILCPAQPLTEKTDVYSFGLVLLEVLCCHREHGLHLSIGVGGRYLHHLVKISLRDQTLHDTIDPYINREIAVASLVTFLRTSFSCLLLQAAERPTAETVVEKLEAALMTQEKAETEKEDSKGKGERGFDLADIYNYSVQDIAPDEVFDIYNYNVQDTAPDEVDEHHYSGMSQEVFVSDDLNRGRDDGLL